MSYTGDYLGWGKGAAAGDVAWDTRKTADLKFWVKYAVNQFYYPPILPGERVSYQWSFLFPSSEFTLPAGGQAIPLPEDYAGFEGTLGLVGADRPPIEIKTVGIGQILREYEAVSNASGQPRFVAVEPIKEVGVGQGQRWQLHVFPAADQQYTLVGRYKIMPQPLTADRPYVYGGPTHSQTILASCLAAVELHRDNMVDGPLNAAFMQRLAASVSLDRELRPEFIGYNADRSDARDWGRGNRHRWGNVITVNGVDPS